MTSKRYMGKPCAYCGVDGSSSTVDHVIAKSFFFEEDRANLPQVPACKKCNNDKSGLEHYATAALLTGTKHVEGDRYRQEEVAPRITKNRKLQMELGINNPPIWIKVDSIVQPMHVT